MPRRHYRRIFELEETMETITEVEKDFAYSQGFLETWVDGEKEPVKTHLKEHLVNIVRGMTFYREKFLTSDEDLTTLRGQLNALTTTAAQYLQVIQQQKEMIEEQLIDSQREIHTNKNYIETP